MSTTRLSEAALGDCHRATVLGNTIAIHMLEFLSSIRIRPPGFDDLAHEFLDVCRIMWALEAGLTECTRNHQSLPRDITQEMDKKFKTTYLDFQSLDQWLSKTLDYEKRGTMGRLQKSWRKIFTSDEVSRMRSAIAKTTEALRMSALIFQWSLGDAVIDDSVGIGYTGLEAALERMDRGKSVAGIAKLKSLEPQHTVREVGHIPTQTERYPQPPVLEVPAGSASSLSSFPSPFPPRGASTNHAPFPDMRRKTSISDHTVSSHGTRSRVPAPSDFTDKHDSATTAATEQDPEDYGIDAQSVKAVHLTPEPSKMPRWQPRTSSATDNSSMRFGLISAIQEKNSQMVEQLLDRGVSPDTGPEMHALREAIVHHDLESVRLLLLFGADVNAPDTFGATPLYMAVENSFVEAASILLKYGASPNHSPGHGSDTPLAYAVVMEKFHLTRLLLTYGGDANHNLINGDTLLIKAISKTVDKHLIDLLLNYGADANGKNGEGKSPLFEAITSSRVDIVTALLDHGANPNLPGPKHMLWPSTYQPQCLKVLLARGADHKKTSGIMELAASINNLESVNILLRAGVNPNAKKDGTYTPLCTSIRDNRPDIFRTLLDNGADPNVPASEYPAFKCVTHFRPQYLAPLVAAGADLNSPKGIIETAVQSNNIEALKWLLDNGVSPNDKVPKTGATALTTAILNNKPDLVELLLARGASPNVRGQDWPVCLAVQQPTILKLLLPALAEPRAFKGVMEMAVTANQLDSVKLLLRAGVSVEDRNGGVFSPLTTAIRERHKEIVKYLLDEAGADPNAPGEHLPIVKAVRRFHEDDTEILEMLLDKGADPNKIYRGHNAIIQAVENGEAGVLRLLVSRCGVDLDARDGSGMTVMEIAESRGWEEGKDILHMAVRIS